MSVLELPNIRPGVLSAILFICLDVALVFLLDEALARITCFMYYRDIDNGQPFHVRSTELIPGFGNFLVGRKYSFVNLFAILMKIALLTIVLLVNLSIGGQETVTRTQFREGTFAFDPSDESISANSTSQVATRMERTKSCFIQDNDILTYYPLRFNLLQDGSALGTERLSNANLNFNINVNESVRQTIEEDEDTRVFQVDDSSIICMSPSNVNNAEPLVEVVGCTRIDKFEHHSCLTIIAAEFQKRADNLSSPTIEPSVVDTGHELWTFNSDEIQRTFYEYEKPQFTCLFTQIGLEKSIVTAEFPDPLEYVHCLLIAHSTGERTSEDRTIVEHWNFLKAGSPGNVDGTDKFIIQYPGIVFKGKLNFGKLASERYLQAPFPFTNYVTMSGELIAQSSYFLNFSQFDNTRVSTLQSTENNVVITTIEFYAVYLLSALVVVVLVLFVSIFIVTRSDKRPRFNTIDGLSSIVREEQFPTGRSYTKGETTILGLAFKGDHLHFGPLRDTDEGVRYVASQNWT